MKRSPTQVMFRYLPGRVFEHEDGFIAKVDQIEGRSVTDVNSDLLLEELSAELERWQPDQVKIPDPRVARDEFTIIQPTLVRWDVFPLTFECVNPRCGRVTRWYQQRRLVDDPSTAHGLVCQRCGARLRQLRYVTAHNCGAMRPLHTQICQTCNNHDNMYFEDHGSFRSSKWNCRACGRTIGTRFTPCDCGRYRRGGGQAYQLGYTARDSRLWTAQTLTIINISNQTYRNLQRHPQRGIVALASWLGDETNISQSLTELDRPVGDGRMTPEEWADVEAALIEKGIDRDTIERILRSEGPVTTGVGALISTIDADVVNAAADRRMVERAGLFDYHVISDRLSFHHHRDHLSGPERTAADNAADVMRKLGIEDISVTQSFPIALASYGYTRSERAPGRADVMSYAKTDRYNGRTPIFAVPAETEALLVTLDARAVLGFLGASGTYSGSAPPTARDAKLELATILATDPSTGTDSTAATIRRLAHSASHALLRALEDGQTGFGESSLAEWIVPDALTTAIYVGSYQDFSLGAFDTVLRRRVAPWLLRAADDVNRCDNDPMCSHTSPQRPHAACDRCLHLSFGCRTWNDDLDRLLLRRFWWWTQRAYATP